ncbi:glycosyltransferase family 4 protein [Acetomicrobium sp.]|uniref:glycosyltransferase family 4 protein n=1 Tax=Acetomicrobium sp. TaxID=1872099 RepID=UPI002B259ADD|nr:glycosyltransferase family 4 protein [Acetomicrobium sp.]
MNLWILNHYAVSPDTPGGTRHFDLARELVKNGHDVTIFASGFDHSTRRYVKITPKEKMKVETYDEVRFVWINTFPYAGNDWRRVANMLSYGWRVLWCDRGIPKPDVIFGSSMHPFAALAGWRLARRHKARFIFEVRDLWPQTAVDMGAMRESSLPAKLLYAWEKFMYKRAEKIIVLLPYAKDYIVSKGISPEKIFWLSNGVDLDRFDHPASLDPGSEVAQVFERARGKFKVVYTGSHEISDGLYVILETAKILQEKLENVHFILIGDGSEKSKLISKAQRLGLMNISFCAPVPKQVIPTVLLTADCLVFPVQNFNVYRFGISFNKAYDYLASSKPIIIAGNPRNNIVKEANCGISVEPENPEALAEAIIEIYNMPKEKRKELGMNGRRYVEQHHSIKVLAEKLETLL